MSDRQVLTVEGMTCTECEGRITSALGELSDVEEASAAHEAPIVTLSVGPGSSWCGHGSRCD